MCQGRRCCRPNLCPRGVHTMKKSNSARRPAASASNHTAARRQAISPIEKLQAAVRPMLEMLERRQLMSTTGGTSGVVGPFASPDGFQGADFGASRPLTWLEVVDGQTVV